MDSAIMRWELIRFDDDNVKCAKSEASKFGTSSASRVIEINYLTGNNFLSEGDFPYHVNGVCATKSKNPDSFMSISYCLSSKSGLNFGIHYLEDSTIDNIVEHSQDILVSYSY
ncbi:LADA_0B10682g1_1 [Lachancea dasiensis]|uniref:LADA_0B10682g1_1 n=1 Tax=Lachancea dasiensis TaxID=1072105 RepID=A0A1G4IVA2_9SACH|nr:LADA_0B10682g1_1 [Lachancea dasiensis]